ncbi:U5 small nuclear ribonucleoprotein TSSC4 [Pelodytes ibericus]
MSDKEEQGGPPKPFSACAYENRLDPDTLSLSDSDPGLSDEADIAYISAEEEEDVEEEHEQDKVQKPPVLPFTLKGTDSTFFQRSQGIFGGLKEVPMCPPPAQRAEHQSSSSDEEIEETPIKYQKSSSEDIALADPTRASAAKTAKPASRLPDYLAHPERWTKYNLEDVPTSSDRTNRKTALSFLADLKQKKEDQTVPPDPSSVSYNQDSSSSGERRILFSRPQKVPRVIGEKSESHSSIFKRSGEWEDDGQDKSEAATEHGEKATLGFHGIKKRSRKNIRSKDNLNEEENSE